MVTKILKVRSGEDDASDSDHEHVDSERLSSGSNETLTSTHSDNEHINRERLSSSSGSTRSTGDSHHKLVSREWLSSGSDDTRASNSSGHEHVNGDQLSSSSSCDTSSNDIGTSKDNHHKLINIERLSSGSYDTRTSTNSNHKHINGETLNSSSDDTRISNDGKKLDDASKDNACSAPSTAVVAFYNRRFDSFHSDGTVSRSARTVKTGTNRRCRPNSSYHSGSVLSSVGSRGYYSDYEDDTNEVPTDTCSQTDEESETDGEGFVVTDTDMETDVEADGDGDNEDEDVVLTVLFEGTANTIDPACTQIGIFYHACLAVVLSSPKDVFSKEEGRGRRRRRYKMGFDGCGMTNGVTGVLFGAGLDAQCDRVVEVVAALRRRYRRNRVKIVAVGQSRGGVACLKLVGKLSRRFDHDRTVKTKRVRSENDDDYGHWLTVSACLFDPVPGNALSTGFPYTAARSMDLRDCRCLRRVLALYPYEPLPDFTFHAPCLPKYHSDTRVEEDVTLGCHQGALFETALDPVDECDVASNLSFRRLSDFFLEEGVPMKNDGPSDIYVTVKRRRIYRPTLEHCVLLCRQALRERCEGDHCEDGVDHYDGDDTIVRRAHDRTGKSRVIVRWIGSDGCTFLNRHHEQLEMTLLRSTLRQYQGRDGGGADYDDVVAAARELLVEFSHAGRRNDDEGGDPRRRFRPRHAYQLDIQSPERGLFVSASGSTSFCAANVCCPTQLIKLFSAADAMV